MPIPIPPPTEQEVVVPMPSPSGVGTRQRPYYLRQRQDWAIEQERMRHNQALYSIGEWIFLILLWHELDFERGLVGRCPRCFGGPTGSKLRRIAEVYAQPTQNECPECYGTSFEGGIRARIVRPAIVSDVEESERQDRRGSVHPGAVTFETTYDFRCRAGDFIVRADDSRWRINSADRLQVRTGFDHPDHTDDAVAYRLPAALEERTSIAYKIPPTDGPLVKAVLTQHMHFPADFNAYEQLSGPLIPPSVLD